MLSLDPSDAETAGNKTTIASMNFNAPAPKQPKQNAPGTKPAGGTKGTAPKASK
ncbi:MAG: hypothetical protein IPP72_10055 [Chitinophagaceae bacterium]|nr:hypothetical protein [Chitinophagaceae bacterium]